MKRATLIAVGGLSEKQVMQEVAEDAPDMLAHAVNFAAIHLPTRCFFHALYCYNWLGKAEMII